MYCYRNQTSIISLSFVLVAFVKHLVLVIHCFRTYLCPWLLSLDFQLSMNQLSLESVYKGVSCPNNVLLSVNHETQCANATINNFRVFI